MRYIITARKNFDDRSCMICLD